jgi:hypothetical protein
MRGKRLPLSIAALASVASLNVSPSGSSAVRTAKPVPRQRRSVIGDVRP